MPLPHEPGPHWGEVGIHGLHRQREWDAVVTVTAAGMAGTEVWFVALPDGKVVKEEGDADPEILSRPVTLTPPYRAHGVQREGGLWVVGATRIEIVELDDDPGGEAVELSWDGVERTVRIDGRPTLSGVTELERLGAARHRTYVVTAARIAGRAWEVMVSPL